MTASEEGPQTSRTVTAYLADRTVRCLFAARSAVREENSGFLDVFQCADIVAKWLGVGGVGSGCEGLLCCLLVAVRVCCAVC